jgi:arginase
VGIISVPYFMGDPMEGFSVPEPHHTVTAELGDGTPQDRMCILYRELAATVADTPNPVVYAGDCVSIIGTLAGLQRMDIEPTLIFFDAHGDFHTWESTPSGFIGGMPLAMVTGRGEQTIVEAAGLTPLPDERAILVDGRDLDPGEDDALASSGVTVMTVDEVTHSEPPRGPLHIHVDTDVVDPADMPAENYPAPGGPPLAAVRRALIHLAVGGEVVAFSISSWNPALEGAERAAAATLQLAAPFLSMAS